MTKAIIITFDFLKDHIVTIANVTIALALFTAAVKAHTIATTIMTVKTKAFAVVQAAWNSLLAVGRVAIIAYTYGLRGANKAMMALNATTKRNIFVLLATTLASVVVVITELITKEKELTAEEKQRNKIQKDSQEIEKKANSEMANKTSRINALTAIIHNNNIKLEERRKAVEALKSIVPKYYAELDEEGRITRENTQAVKDHVEMLKQEAMLKASKDKISSLSGEKLDIETEKGNSETIIADTKREIEAWKKRNAALAKYVNWNADGTLNTEGRADQHPAYIASRREVNFIPEGEKPYGYSNQDFRYSFWLNEYTKLEQLNKVIKKENSKIEEQTKKSEDIDSRISNIAEKAKETSALIASLLEEQEEDDDKGGGKDLDTLKEKRDKIRQLYELKKLQKRLEFESGTIDQEQYQKDILQIELEAYTAEREIYSKKSSEWIAMENKRIDTINALKEQSNDYSLHQIDVETEEEKRIQQKRYAEGEITEKEYQDKLTEIQINALKRRAVYLLANDPGSKEQMAAQKEYQEALYESQIRKKEEFLDKAKAFEKEYNLKTNQEKMNAELAFLDELIAKEIIKEEEKAEYIKKIREKYSKDDNKEKKEEEHHWSASDPLSSSVVQFGEALADLNQKVKDGEATWEDYAEVAVGALGMVSAMMNSASQLNRANMQLEEAKINARYDAEIKAAGKNTKKKRQLEEKRQREMAKMKSRENKKAMRIEIAQAVASTAMAAINSYASASKVSWVLGPIAAAAATAAGMIQIAAIKKQHEAQEMGYYAGGFTGGKNYRNKAGVVHEGEFVANHQAVNNPNILPYLQLIDHAQRNNSISSLSASDIANMMPSTQGSHSTSTVQVVDSSSAETAQAISKLNQHIEEGIQTYVTIDGPNGIKRQLSKYESLTNR